MLQAAYPDFGAVIASVQAAGLFASLCTLQQPDGAQVGSGQASGNYVDVPGLTNIPCMNAPISDSRIQATEVKELEETESLSIRHILLNKYYPAIPAADPQGWQAIVDGVTYDLLGAESDSQKTMTRLHLQTATI